MNVELLTFVLPANGTARIERAGGYLEVIQADFNIASIALDGPDGNAAAFLRNVLSGIYARSKFGAVSIVNGATAQTVVLMVADAEAGSNRQPGTVEVVDGGKARTLAGQALWGWANYTSAGGLWPVVQVWNLAGSGKRLIVKAVTVSTGAAGRVSVGSSIVARTNQGQMRLKLVLPVASSAAMQKQTGDQSGGGLGAMWAAQVAANTPFTYQLQEPVVCTEGSGFAAWVETADTSMTASFECVEEPAT